MLELIKTKRTDPRLLGRMRDHYSQPKGFVGRNICYAVLFDSVYFGHIIGGSATRFLPNRNEYLEVNITQLNHIVNNIFFNVRPYYKGFYPCRNFTPKVVKLFVNTISLDWREKYGDEVYGFETLIEKPRVGELYLRAGWECIGETKGYTCKRIAGKGTDSWTGKRVWNTDAGSLRPKYVLCLKTRE